MPSQVQPTALTRQRVPPPPFVPRPAPPRSDPSRNRPLRWTQRYEIVLRLHFTGRRTIEIAAELRYSPLFDERKAAFLRDLTGDPRAAFLDGIRRDAVPNFGFLRSVRDDATLSPRIRVRAAQEIAALFERLVPQDGRE
jgi:hypothetical protein